MTEKSAPDGLQCLSDPEHYTTMADSFNPRPYLLRTFSIFVKKITGQKFK